MESYIKQIWKGYPDKTTPVTADKLNHMENGIEQNSNCIGDLDELETTEKGNLVEAVNELNSKKSHVGMIIQSTTLDTMEKVIAEYGGTSWEKIEGRFLLGQSSSYAINSTGGNKDAIIPYHYHSMTFSKSSETGYTGGTIASGASGVGYVGRVYVGGNATPSKETKNTAYAGSSGNATNANMPPYRTVYIWERTA